MRPGTSLARRLVTMTIGVAIGITAGLASITLAAADRVEPAHPVVFDATHLPPLLTISGEPVELAYDVHCASGDDAEAEAGCDVRGAVFVRSAGPGRYERHELEIRMADGSRQLVARVPDELAGQPDGFEYYAVIEAGARPAAHGSRRRCGCATRLSSAEAPGRCCPTPTRVRQPPTRRRADCVRVVGRWRHASRPRTGTRARHDRTLGVRRRRGRDPHRPRSGESPISPLAQGRTCTCSHSDLRDGNDR